jgi:TetR/AcrR family transcriptional regulator, transcriptional repressor for nem operon
MKMKSRIEIADWPETKRKVVDAGVTLMRSRGFNATTLDEICEEAGVTKGALFHYFSTKDEVAKAALERFHERKRLEFQNAPFRKLADPLDRVFGRLDFAIESASAPRLTKGCLIGTLAQELSFTNRRLRQACQEALARIADDFERDLSEAKAAYAPRATFGPKGLAMLYVSIVQGSLILAKASESNRVLIENLEQFRAHVQMLFGKARRSAAGVSSNTAAIAGT